ncbi:MAG: hypothetical protein HUU28_11480 [Planctomycetaceae bacterium]|nr:hypothetical protein [Planctomycetaceae bacterium]
MSTTHALRVRRTARVEVHGDPRTARETWILVHGYAQVAADMLAECKPLESRERLLVVPEALSRFYRRGSSGPIGASWMTRELREDEIADYVEYLDEVARQLGSPPRELAIGEILSALRSRFPEMAGKSNDSLSASMDFQTINVRGRANTPGDFRRADRWNRFPAFLKTGRGVYRRLSEHERAEFLRRWAGGDPLLQRESFDAADWDRLLR